MSEDKSPIRPTTPEAIQLAKTLMRTSRYGALAVLDSSTDRPLASRVAVATDVDGTPIILVSGLAAHTPGLIAHPACSLLLGEVGKGDPSLIPALHSIAPLSRLSETQQITPTQDGVISITIPKAHCMSTWATSSFPTCCRICQSQWRLRQSLQP